MPTYSIPGPDGKTYSIDGPEGATRDQVIAKIREKLSEKGGEPVSTAGDIAKSAGQGIIKGAENWAGAFPSLVGAAAKGINTALETYAPGFAKAMGISPEGDKQQADLAAQIQQLRDKQLPDYHPKTTAGKYAESIGEFAPTAVVGPGGIPTKIATTIGGGAGAEGAAEMFGDNAWSRFFGGLLGGGLTGLTAAEAKSLRLSGRLPSIDAIKDSGTQAYKAVANARLKATQPAIDQFVSDSRTALDDRLIVQQNAPRTFRALEKLEKAGGDIGQIMGIRQTLGEIAPREGTEYSAARDVISRIDDFVENLSPRNVIQGDPKFTQAMLDHARASWRSYKKLDEIEQAGEHALERAQTTGTGANYINTVRQEIRKILHSDSRSRGYSDAAKKQMEKIALGTWATNSARWAGKYAPSGPVSAIPTIAAYALKGKLAAATVVIGATLAKYLGKYLTNRQLRELTELIRGESPTGRPIAAQNAAQQHNIGAVFPSAAARSAIANPPFGGMQTDLDQMVQPTPQSDKRSELPSDSIFKTARRAKDGKVYVRDPKRPGKYLMVVNA